MTSPKDKKKPPPKLPGGKVPRKGKGIPRGSSSTLPVLAPSREVKVVDPLRLYLQEIGRYKLLSPEEEKALALKLVETGDLETAKALVRANLRLVVKIAMEYRHAYSNILDLIQEGNIGLMKAVSKYDPAKGAKLSYYASWWIKSYILKFILDNFRLVRIGSTAEQKKLFFNLLKERERLERMGVSPNSKRISQNLGVSEKSVKMMEQVLLPGGGEVSLEKPVFDDSSKSLGDILADEKTPGIDEQLAHDQEVNILKSKLHEFMTNLKERDREIFEKRLLAEIPLSLQAIADDYGVSRERIRQIEERLIGKLKVYMEEFIR
ncbi:MAG: RNA polymerase factor sigma-32 [Bacteriovoracales bacterium]|nr:RNA polymerase factor sigma-32 [Bacteriovoracales bacterium]